MYNYYYTIIAVRNAAIGGTAVGPGGGREGTVEGSLGSVWGVDVGAYRQTYNRCGAVLLNVRTIAIQYNKVSSSLGHLLLLCR